MTRYRRGAPVVDAVRFDGTAAAVMVLLAAFGCRRDGDESLMVPTPCGAVFIGAGLWVLRDHGSLSVVDDDTFACFYEPIPAFESGAAPPC